MHPDTTRGAYDWSEDQAVGLDLHHVCVMCGVNYAPAGELCSRCEG